MDVSLIGELDALLHELGYTRVRDHCYLKLEKHAEIEHFLFLESWGAQRSMLSVEFGVRHRPTEEFSRGFLVSQLGAAFSNLKFDISCNCYFRCALGRLANWEPRWSIDTASLPFSLVLRTIKVALTFHHSSFVKEISRKKELFAFLLGDSEPMPWFRTNGLIRLTQIGFLAVAERHPLSEVEPLLREVADGKNIVWGRGLAIDSFLVALLESLSNRR